MEYARAVAVIEFSYMALKYPEVRSLCHAPKFLLLIVFTGMNAAVLIPLFQSMLELPAVLVVVAVVLAAIVAAVGELALVVWFVNARERARRRLLDRGLRQLEAGNWDDAALHFEALRKLARGPEWKLIGAYNLACAHARSGRVEDSVRILTPLLEETPWFSWSCHPLANSREDWPAHISADPDLEPLKSEPAFKTLLDRPRPA